MHVDPAGFTTVIEDGRVMAGRYRLLFKVGDGGLAEVFRARDERLDRIVAVKVLRPQYMSDLQSRSRFAIEAKAAARLSHPNIVDVYDYGEAPGSSASPNSGSMFIVMEYVDGQTLGELLRKRGKLSHEETISIAQQVCYALSAAHAKGLIHRDVKPQNIMIGRDGTVCLTDFGIVKALSESRAALTQAGMTLGTASYISPEQATGGVIGPASDVYALGCVMYEMLSGVPPFAGKNSTEVAYRQVWEQPRPLSELVPEVLPELEAIIMHCLNKEPERRYPDATTLAADLGKVKAIIDQPTQLLPIISAVVPTTATVDKQPESERSEAAPVAPVRIGGYPQVKGQDGSKAEIIGVVPPSPPPVHVRSQRRTGAPAVPVYETEEDRQLRPYIGSNTYAARPERAVRSTNTGRLGLALIALMLIGLSVAGVAIFAWQSRSSLDDRAGSNSPLVSMPTSSVALPTATQLPEVEPSPTVPLGQIVIEPPGTPPPAPWPTNTPQSGLEVRSQGARVEDQGPGTTIRFAQ